jgi:hypothetical protein
MGGEVQCKRDPRDVLRASNIDDDIVLVEGLGKGKMEGYREPLKELR